MARTDFVPSPKFEEYKEVFKQHFHMEKREDGVLLVQMHTNGEETLWSEELHRAIWQMWLTVGSDPTVELVIFTAVGDHWINKMDDQSWLDELDNPGYARYEHMYYDGRRMAIAQIFGTEIPTIGVINGPGQHMELGLMCDMCIMADDTSIVDPHYRVGMVPGDGFQIALHELAGYRRSVYMELMNYAVPAKEAVDWGLVSEAVPREKLLARAYEMADVIMKQDRPIRRLSSSVLRRRWREAIAAEHDGAFGIEMFGNFTHEDVSHAAINEESFYDNDVDVAPEENRKKVAENKAKLG